MIFEDYTETGYLYHVVSLTDLDRTLKEGIKFDSKRTYLNKYIDFHSYLDAYRPTGMPSWVERKKAIFASMNFKDSHCWHSHTAILKITVDEKKCWVCNENIANFLFEPFILQHIEAFKDTKEYVEQKGSDIVKKYWDSSLSFRRNLELRCDKKEGYDAEVLVMHDIPPEDLKCIYIISDHKAMTWQEWKKFLSLR